jgi:hypothetical protein
VQQVADPFCTTATKLPENRQQQFGKSLGSSLVGCNACGEAFREHLL